MADKITEKDLKFLTERINRLTNSPLTYYSPDGTINVGYFRVASTYGGVSLERTVNNGGGITQPLGAGIYTKKEMYMKLQAFIYGLEFSKKE